MIISGNTGIGEVVRQNFRTSQLEDFERDLHRHVHLETGTFTWKQARSPGNNILSPEAIGLEKELNELKNK